MSYAKSIYEKCINKGMSQKKAYAATGAILAKQNAKRESKKAEA